MAVKTAICKNTFGEAVPVECRLWENWHGATYLSKTVEQLGKDHPDLTFDGWVYDLDSEEDKNAIRMYFLSPNVTWREVWVFTTEGFTFKKIYREDV